MKPPVERSRACFGARSQADEPPVIDNPPDYGRPGPAKEPG